MDSLGVYISVPFCKAKCTFCNFASDAFGLDRLDGYVNRVCREIALALRHAAELGAFIPSTVDSIYFGGGTPSLLRPEQLQNVFASLRSKFSIESDAEITLECAPGQLDNKTLDAALRQGVNRISLGVQSFVDSETAAVGRQHTARQCLAEIARIRAAGVNAISVDLIAGLPGQTAESWKRSLDAVTTSGIPHASVYMLEVDDESRLGRELMQGGVRYQARCVPSDDSIAEFYVRACEVFPQAGLKQYEISNFAREGCESIHNLKYWQRRPYLGFGLDAHSMLQCSHGALRFANADALDRYMAEEAPVVTSVDQCAAFEETLFLGLRMNAGVDWKLLQAEFQPERAESCADAIRNLLEANLLNRQGNRIALTNRGRMVSNEVFGELLRAAATREVTA